MLDRAKAAGHISGVANRVVPGELSHLQYANDTLILIKNSEKEIVTVNFLLMCFEAMLGLKVNFDQSEAILIGGDLDLNYMRHI